MAYEGDPTTEIDIKGLLQLKLSLDEKLSKLDGEILELVDDGAVEEIEQARKRCMRKLWTMTSTPPLLQLAEH